MSKSLRLFAKQTRQRLRSWLQYDPEYAHFLPRHHMDYRKVSPGSQPEAIVPKIRDVDMYYHTYLERDQTYNEDAWRRNFEVFYRFQMLESPLKLLPGQVVGPFYDMGRPQDRGINLGMDRPQVYTYRRKPINRQYDAHVEKMQAMANEARDRIQKDLMREATERQGDLIAQQRANNAEERARVKKKRDARRKSRVTIAQQPDVSQILKMRQQEETA